MGDYLFAGGLVLTAGFLVWVGYQIGHDYSDRERRLEQSRSWNWYQKHLENCARIDELEADRYEAEAAVEAAQAIVMGRAA
jgi:hypothetical protein